MMLLTSGSFEFSVEVNVPYSWHGMHEKLSMISLKMKRCHDKSEVAARTGPQHCIQSFTMCIWGDLFREFAACPFDSWPRVPAGPRHPLAEFPGVHCGVCDGEDSWDHSWDTNWMGS